MLPCPLHASLPSGHATEAFLIARLLLALLAGTKGDGSLMHLWANQLMRQSSRIAVNRTVAGLHFPVDSAAGALLGLTLAEYLIGLCTGADSYRPSTFDGTKYPINAERRGVGTDFNWEELYDADNLQLRIDGTAARFAKIERRRPYGERSMPLRWLWNKAKAEWDLPPGNSSRRRHTNGRKRG